MIGKPIADVPLSAKCVCGDERRYHRMVYAPYPAVRVRLGSCFKCNDCQMFRLEGVGYFTSEVRENAGYRRVREYQYRINQYKSWPEPGETQITISGSGD